MEKYQPPTEPTSMAQLLWIPLGEFDPENNQYTVTVEKFNPEAINFFKTLHGGAIGAACDDIAGMTIYSKYGVNSAATKKATIEFYTPVRPTSELVFTCKITVEMQSIIYIWVKVERQGKLIADMTATWSLTPKFLAYLEAKEKTST